MTMLLVLDYPGRRDDPLIADLDLEAAGFDVRYVLLDPLPRVPRAARYAEELVASLDLGGPARAVLAFCMAAPIAQDVARLVGAPALLCFDGEPSTYDAVESEYRGVRAPFGSGGLPAWWDRTELAADPERVLARIEDDLLGLARATLAADGLEELAPQLVAAYVDWLAHLIAAHHAEFPMWGGEVLHVVSRDHAYAGDWPGARDTTTVRLETAREKLLRHEETRRVVLELLGHSGGSA
jgi:hypothetical protein